MKKIKFFHEGLIKWTFRSCEDGACPEGSSCIEKTKEAKDRRVHLDCKPFYYISRGSSHSPSYP